VAEHLPAVHAGILFHCLTPQPKINNIAMYSRVRNKKNICQRYTYIGMRILGGRLDWNLKWRNDRTIRRLKWLKFGVKLLLIIKNTERFRFARSLSRYQKF